MPIQRLVNAKNGPLLPFGIDRHAAVQLAESGRTWARIASLIETCKLNGVEPYAYLKATLETIAKGHPASHIDELMPWNFDKQA